MAPLVDKSGFSMHFDEFRGDCGGMTPAAQGSGTPVWRHLAHLSMPEMHHGDGLWSYHAVTLPGQALRRGWGLGAYPPPKPDVTCMTASSLRLSDLAVPGLFRVGIGRAPGCGRGLAQSHF